MKRYNDLYFTTCSIINWRPLLRNDDFKDIVIESFKFTVKQKRATIWAFVIMEDHMHLIWQILHPYSIGKVRQSILKFTAQQFKFKLLDGKNHAVLEKHFVGMKDREYQFWQKNPLNIEIYSDTVLKQKINYIHLNLERKYGDQADYKYSSWPYYRDDVKNWDFLF